MNNLFISRSNHDRMMDNNCVILQMLFHEYERKWSLGGVTFFNVSDEHIDCVQKIIMIK